MKAFILLLAGSAAAWPQLLTFGVKGGVPVTDALEAGSSASLNASYFTKTKRYAIGPSAELRLPFGFGAELDAIYRRLNYDLYFASQEQPIMGSYGSTTANFWEFPLLLKYRFRGELARPFVSAGPSFNRVSGLKQVVSCFYAGGACWWGGTSKNPPEFKTHFSPGFALAGGFELKLPVLRIAPEVRFTHWTTQNFREPAASLLNTRQNQAEVLLGISF